MRSLWLACVVLASIRPALADERQDRQRAEQVCLARDPSCDWLATLSSLERQSVLRGIKKRGYELEPLPWGKTIGRVRVYNEDVFAEKFGLLEFFNHFHVTTKEHAIEVETTINAGDVWDQERVNETARRLRDPLWTSVVVVLPVKNLEPGKVDLLIITRDIWSLRLNTQYTFQQGSLTDLSIALSENNFLGRRSVFALGFLMDQGAIATGPVFIDKNLFGKKLSLVARYDLIYNRQNLQDKVGLLDGPPTISERDAPGFNREGSASSITLSQPLFSLASEWGWSTSFSHRFAINRQFRGLELSPRDCSSGDCFFPLDPNNPNHVQSVLDIARDGTSADILRAQYRVRSIGASASVTRQWGTALKQQLQFGHSVASVKASVLPSFPGNDIERDAFIRDVLPRQEVTSAPFVSYGFFKPTFKTFRNISTFDLAEDGRLGVAFDATASFGLKLLGSDNNFQRGSLSASWGFPWCHDGLVRPEASISARYQDLDKDGDHEFIDNTASVGVRVVTPTYGWARVVAESTIATRWNDSTNSFFAIGSSNGLRGFLINEFRGQRTGDRLIRNQIELRTVPRKLWVVRYGGVLFYELGGVSDRWLNLDSTHPGMQLHHDVGAGFRMLIPQTARDLFRFDLAVPLDGGSAGKLRFIAGFESAF